MTSLRFGKHPAKNDYRTLKLKDYLALDLSAPPVSFNNLEKVYGKLNNSNPSNLFPMDGNDTYGDCTIAALAHAMTVYNGLVGQSKIMVVSDVTKLYFSLSKGVDSGLIELDVLNYWQSNPIDGDQIFAFVKIDPKNHTHIQQAIQIFGGVYLGFQVQQNCQEDFEAGRPWTPGALTNDGHAVFAVAYDQSVVTVLTWGTVQLGTWDWWDECVDEAYAILPPQAESIIFDGINFEKLKADLNQVAS